MEACCPLGQDVHMRQDGGGERDEIFNRRGISRATIDGNY